MFSQRNKQLLVEVEGIFLLFFFIKKYFFSSEDTKVFKMSIYMSVINVTFSPPILDRRLTCCDDFHDIYQ